MLSTWPFAVVALAPPEATATVRFAQQHRLELEIEVQPDQVMVWVNSDTLPEEDSSRRQFVIAASEAKPRPDEESETP